MNFDADLSYSRLRAEMARSPRLQPRPTRGQKALELTLFGVFGLTLALAGVALYATNRPEHRMVPNRMDAGIGADRVNVLLIGSSLRTRSGGDSEVRIESVMLLSLQPSTGRAALMSLPLDLWVKVGRYGERPLRAAHALGDSGGYPGAGTGLTVDTVEQIIAKPVHAYARFSIGDLQRLVDTVGGIDINVRQGVYEYHSKSRFRAGEQHFTGMQATRYAYSAFIAGRTAANRFARERRQQDVVLAALAKALRTRDDIDSFVPVFGTLTATNLRDADTDVLVSALRRGDNVKRISFADCLDAFDVTSVAYRGEAVRPRSGNFTTLQKIADAAFDSGVARVH